MFRYWLAGAKVVCARSEVFAVIELHFGHPSGASAITFAAGVTGSVFAVSVGSALLHPAINNTASERVIESVLFIKNEILNIALNYIDYLWVNQIISSISPED